MKPFVLMIAVVAAMLPVQARAAFQTCADARNYGANTARLFVSQVFNRGNCRANGLGQSHDALVNVWKTQVLRTNDSDQEKVCYYEGLWAGTLEGLSTE